MSWVNYKNTQAVGLKLKHDLDVISTVTNYSLQVIFIFYYLFSVITKVNRIVYFLIYLVFLIIAIGLLVFDVFFAKKIDKNIKRKIKDIVRYAKYPIRVFLIGLAVLAIAQGDSNSLAIIATAVSAGSLLLQILIQLVIKFVRRYLELFGESLRMDYEESDLIKSVYNAYRYPQPKKKALVSGIVVNKIMNGINDFVNTNKDSAPPRELSSRDEKIREDIVALKKEYNLLDEDEIVVASE